MNNLSDVRRWLLLWAEIEMVLDPADRDGVGDVGNDLEGATAASAARASPESGHAVLFFHPDPSHAGRRRGRAEVAQRSHHLTVAALRVLYAFGLPLAVPALLPLPLPARVATAGIIRSCSAGACACRSQLKREPLRRATAQLHAQSCCRSSLRTSQGAGLVGMQVARGLRAAGARSPLAAASRRGRQRRGALAEGDYVSNAGCGGAWAGTSS